MDQSGPPLLHSWLIHLPPSEVFIYIQEYHTHQDMKRISIRLVCCRGGTFRLIALLFYYYLHFGKCQSAMRDVKLPTLWKLSALRRRMSGSSAYTGHPTQETYSHQQKVKI
jgi:hypothetical protein